MLWMLEGLIGLIIFQRARGSRLGYPWPFTPTAAQTSAGGTACSLLPAAGSAAAQASSPHRTPIAGLAIPLLTHTCCYSPAMENEPVNPRTIILPSTWETAA